jgi:hypothetical protein
VIDIPNNNKECFSGFSRGSMISFRQPQFREVLIQLASWLLTEHFYSQLPSTWKSASGVGSAKPLSFQDNIK